MGFLYNLLRIPYWNVIVTRYGEKVYGTEIPIKHTNTWFRVRKHKAIYILPDLSDMRDTPPVKIGSGYVLIYDVDNVFPLSLVSSEMVEEIKKDENSLMFQLLKGKSATLAVKPSYWVKSQMNVERLHEFFEARVTEDILSQPKQEFPMWVVYLIACATVGAIILGSIFLITKGQVPPTIMQNISTVPTIPIGGGFYTVP
jgi:hypothetical protein